MGKRDESLLLKAETAITNVKTVPALSEALRALGYTPERLAEGEKLLAAAKSLDAVQKKEYGEQYQATEQQNAQREKLNTVYIMHLQLARIAFAEDAAAFTGLQLGGTRKESLSGSIAQMATFYTNLLANNAWQQSLAKFNIQKQQLDAAQQELQKLQAAYSSQMKETGEAQKATQKRDEAVDALQAWFGPFVKVARIALGNNPQMLEMLGVTAR